MSASPRTRNTTTSAAERPTNVNITSAENPFIDHKHIEPLIAVSTSHGTPACINALEREATSHTGHGFFLSIPDTDALTSDEYHAALARLSINTSLIRLLVDAQKAGINWILFDGDAEPVDGYETHENTWP